MKKAILFMFFLLFVYASLLSPQKLFAQKDLNMKSIDVIDSYYDSYLGEYNKYVNYYSSDINDFYHPEKSSRYPSDNLFDGNFNTCWVAGSYKTKSYDTLYVGIPKEIDLDKVILNIFPAYGKSKTLYHQNARPKKIKISIYAGYYPEGYCTEVVAKYFIKKYSEKIIELKDSFGVQSFPLNLNKQKLINFQKNNVNEAKSSAKLSKFFSGNENSDIKISDTSFFLKIEILDVYQGTKYNDVCISELFFNNRFVTPSPLKDNKIVNVYIKNDNTLLADYANEKAVVIYKDTSSVFTMVDWNKNANFAILHYVKNDEVGPGSRVEELYSLVDLKNRKIVDKEFEKCTGHTSMFGAFEKKYDNIFIKNIAKYGIELK